MNGKNQIKKFKNQIWLSSPTMHGDELKFVEEAYKTNWMSTVGENINELERIVTRKTGMLYAVALNSGTAAVHMAVKLAGIRPGDKVFVSDLTFVATVNPIIYEGGIPIFIDSEYETWNMNPIALKKAFQRYPEVKAVVFTHLYGVPGKMNEILKVCESYGAVLIEDAAESLGASYEGIQTGCLGTYNCLSFNGNKIITGTSGGMLLTNNKKEAEKVKKWSTQSKEAAPWYQHTEIGYNYRMSNVIAGVVRGQFPYLKEHIEKKKAIYKRYKDGFENLPVQMNPFDGKKSKPNYWLSCCVINKEAMCIQEHREQEARYESKKGKSCPVEILEMFKTYNIEGRPIWKPMHMQPIFQNNKFISENEENRKKLAVGTDIFMRGFCLPSDTKMTKEQQKIIIELVKQCFDS